MTTQAEITQKNHHRAVRFFWGLLLGATLVSLVGNEVHALLPYIPKVVIEIGAAAVPPIVLLAAVHGIALAVRAGASGRVYRCATAAVAVIGMGAFMLSFRALRDLLIETGTPAEWAWVFPAIIDTAVGVSTLMLVALGDKPARRARTVTSSTGTQTPAKQRLAQPPTQNAKGEVTPFAPASARAQTSASVQPDPAQTMGDSAQVEVTEADAERAQVDANLASELIASGVTTQAVETVIAVLAARRNGASINAAAKGSGINYRTAQRIVQAAAENRQRELAVAS
ncbi:Protein of unknown function (DUF2637) [Mycobacterium sp. JS623]|uniref:DUF2637 domain-containing protein n=1 Tax=Mycobacterium sp. JS623 TaxID=212767 RepID=UPI0002A59B9B|nr:DUF2637 domain-containing protein [Mycobacterium sp. JS623]AGB26259.1 Protein of unknown function (DUF2637) [Mycobacterium sp. JS623]